MTIEQQIRKGIKILKQGDIIAYPTDTVYGLGADAFNEQAVERVYQVKQRPHHLALPLLLAEVSWIERVAVSVPDIAWQLAERFLPGALTLVLPKAPSLPNLVAGGGNTVAVRVPAHPVPIALIRGLGKPIVGTSANISGQPSPLTAEEVIQQLGSSVALVINGGRCPGGVESTVLDVTTEPPTLLREGAIPRWEIEKVGNIKLMLSQPSSRQQPRKE